MVRGRWVVAFDARVGQALDEAEIVGAEVAEFGEDGRSPPGVAPNQ
jgi:hypothetical protein